MTQPPLSSALTLDPELSTLAAATWHGAHVFVVHATGLWYLYGGPRPKGGLEGFLELGGSREAAEAKLRELVAAAEPRLSVQQLRSQLPGERL